MPYDRLARTPLHRWWRPVVGTLAVAAGFVVVGVVVLFLGVAVAAMAGVQVFSPVSLEFADPVLGLAITLASIAFTLPVVYGVAWLVQRRPPGTLSSVLGRLRWRWLLLCLPVALGAGLLGQFAVVLVLSLTGADSSSGGFGWVGWERFLPGLLVTLLLVPFQAAAEEYLFRGWVLQAFGAFLRTPWPGILLGAAGFTALHAYTDWGIIDVFAFGALMGWLAIRTGGLEAPIALHVINNVLGLGLSSASGSLGDALRQGSVPWQSLAGTLVQLTIFAVAVLALVRRRNIATTSPEARETYPLSVNS
ncbi:hypothetical protein Misp01_26550 [Microtetraspora sp. NBRC 13810]|nr:hypothetical protein Misp01_26550 [Microtetraspora sp. NBRC 13810]